MTIRVIQWATGSVGTTQLQEIIEHPELELVGGFVYSKDKVGIDAGTLCGFGLTGVMATDDRRSVIDLEADVVVHAASKVNEINTNSDDIEALLASGKNVITTTNYNHLPTYDPEIKRRFEAACASGHSSFFAAGENPGFMMQRLAMTLSGLCKRIDHLAVEEYFNCDWMTSNEMVFDGMLMGAPPESVTVESPMFKINSLQYQQELGATADVLGIALDRIEPSIEVACIDHDIDIPAGHIASGTVAGQRMSWTGYRQSNPFH